MKIYPGFKTLTRKEIIKKLRNIDVKRITSQKKIKIKIIKIRSFNENKR